MLTHRQYYSLSAEFLREFRRFEETRINLQKKLPVRRIVIIVGKVSGSKRRHHDRRCFHSSSWHLGRHGLPSAVVKCTCTRISASEYTGMYGGTVLQSRLRVLCRPRIIPGTEMKQLRIAEKKQFLAGNLRLLAKRVVIKSQRSVLAGMRRREI